MAQDAPGAQVLRETQLQSADFLPGGNGEAPVPLPHHLIGQSTQWRGSNSPRVLV